MENIEKWLKTKGNFWYYGNQESKEFHKKTGWSVYQMLPLCSIRNKLEFIAFVTILTRALLQSGWRSKQCCRMFAEAADVPWS